MTPPEVAGFILAAMKLGKMAIATVLLSVWSTGQQTAKPETAQVRVSVTALDTEQLPIEHIRVLLIHGRTDAPLEATTPRNGRVEFVLDEGLYDIVLTAPGSGFAPVARQLPLDRRHPLDFKLKMKVAECVSPYCEY